MGDSRLDGNTFFKRRNLLGAMTAAALLVALTAPGIPTPQADAQAPGKCGRTTLKGTIEFTEETRSEGNPLECGPGQPIFVRKRLAKSFIQPHRHSRQTSLLNFFTIADVQLADEEAPARAEWSDKCSSTPFGGSGFRPHETMVPHLMNAHTRAAAKIAKKGGPVLGDEFNFAIGLGDLADNMQYNEIRWIIDLFDGGKILDPDSGADGYDGVQTEDPEGSPSAPIESPVEGERILDLANEPFWAKGLRFEGTRLPWYTLPGNHDVKVQGTAPNSEAWNAFVNEYNQGGLKIMEGFDPEEQQEACNGDFSDPEFYEGLFSNPQFTQPVPADADRRMFVDRQDWAEEHFTTTGRPEGHGYNHQRCRNKEGELLERLCYSFTKGKFLFIGLDSNPDEGLETGNIDRPQWRWLKRKLKNNSRRFYTSQGKKRRNTDGRNKLIVVFAHHPTVSMDNEETEGAKSGEDLVDLLLRFPNVIANANGHTHQNKIWPRRNKELGTSYWEVNTSAIADYPTQSRTIEIANNHDGTLSIYAVVFNADLVVNPREIDWHADDHTHETDLAGEDRDINENWLASYGQEVLFYDPQQDLTKIGRPKDRNVELLLRAPRWFRRR
jgi:metallophosphoesterase (TIGR03767 family)